MASAGRPFTDALVTALVARGIAVAPITLHTGVSSQEAGEAPAAGVVRRHRRTARLVDADPRAGGRVVAVGTTVTRALESAGRRGTVAPWLRRGWTDRVVTPAAPAGVVDGLITGWHDPQASTCCSSRRSPARASPRRVRRGRRPTATCWHEFGDAALFLP